MCIRSISETVSISSAFFLHILMSLFWPKSYVSHVYSTHWWLLVKTHSLLYAVCSLCSEIYRTHAHTCVRGVCTACREHVAMKSALEEGPRSRGVAVAAACDSPPPAGAGGGAGEQGQWRRRSGRAGAEHHGDHPGRVQRRAPERGQGGWGRSVHPQAPSRCQPLAHLGLAVSARSY